MVLGFKGLVLPDRDTLVARADEIQTRFGLPAKKWLRMIRPLPVPAPDAPAAFTD